MLTGHSGVPSRSTGQRSQDVAVLGELMFLMDAYEASGICDQTLFTQTSRLHAHTWRHTASLRDQYISKRARGRKREEGGLGWAGRYVDGDITERWSVCVASYF